jgi:asparagine synthase (glutamine-hydrolysing)
VLLDRGVIVLCAEAKLGSLRVLPFADGSGVVLGALFERNSRTDNSTPSRRMTLSAQSTALTQQSHGRWLIENGWGNYVAFARNSVTGMRWVLKDPTGTLPCLRTEWRGLTIFYSCVSDCTALGLRFTPSRDYLRNHLIAGSGPSRYRALEEISQVCGGTCIQFPADGSPKASRESRLWSPGSFLGRDDLIEDPNAAAGAIRNVVRSATHTWAGCHNRMLLRLSGGLDSSIVAGCLRDAPNNPDWAAYTYFSPGGRSDERPWARLAVEHVGCAHIETAISPATLDLARAESMQESIEPASTLSYLQRTSLEGPLAAQRKATAIFTGDGGDSGFCSDSVSFAAIEYLRRRGPSREWFRLASRVALWTEQSSWNVLASALRRAVIGVNIGMQRQRLLASCTIVDEEVRQAFRQDDRFPHPWFQDRRRTPWDQIRRVGALICNSDFYNVGATEGDFVPEIVSPLYSQPVLELLLRIPIYIHFEDGRDRGLARRSFARDVPAPILRRLWKDRAPGFHAALVAHHREFLRHTLLDGLLVRDRLLDRAALESALSTVPGKSQALPGEILRHLDAELWMRRWHTNGVQQAAAA